MAERGGGVGAASLYAGIFAPDHAPSGQSHVDRQETYADAPPRHAEAPSDVPAATTATHAPSSARPPPSRSTALQFVPRKKTEGTRPTKSATRLLPPLKDSGGQHDASAEHTRIPPRGRPDEEATEAGELGTAQHPSAQPALPPPLRIPEQELEKDRARAWYTEEQEDDARRDPVAAKHPCGVRVQLT